MMNDFKPKQMLTETMEEKLKKLNTVDKEASSAPFDFGNNLKYNKFELIKRGLIKEDDERNLKIFY